MYPWNKYHTACCRLHWFSLDFALLPALQMTNRRGIGFNNQESLRPEKSFKKTRKARIGPQKESQGGHTLPFISVEILRFVASLLNKTDELVTDHLYRGIVSSLMRASIVGRASCILLISIFKWSKVMANLSAIGSCQYNSTWHSKPARCQWLLSLVPLQ